MLQTKQIVFLLLVLICNVGQTLPFHKYCIIGAGPAGVQLGSFFASGGFDYVVFERSAVPGSFFIRYPRHKTLISINKRFTGKNNEEFQLRHDWNSLLHWNSSLRFTKYSDKFFPSNQEFVHYIKDFAEFNQLNIRYNTNVLSLEKTESDLFLVATNGTDSFLCEITVVASGIDVPNVPNFSWMKYAEGYEDVDTNPRNFAGQHVAIFGNGNSAFEVATKIYEYTRSVHILGRNRIRLSWETHYVGDLRGVNNNLLDTYQLKSLDAVAEGSLDFFDVVQLPDKRLKLVLKEVAGLDSAKTYNIEQMSGKSLGNDRKLKLLRDIKDENSPIRQPYDRIIRCLGFTSNRSIFTPSTYPGFETTVAHGKYPAMKYNYEARNVSNLYFTGALAHLLDYRKAAGGFIHGFRYTARALFNLLLRRHERRPWPSKTVAFENLHQFILKRINEASGPYQMFSQLGDIYLLKEEQEEAVFLPEVPVDLLPNIDQMTGHNLTNTGLLVFIFEYGPTYSKVGGDPFRISRAVGRAHLAYRSNFLHPVFYYYKQAPTVELMANRPPHSALPQPDRLMHIVEDFLTEFADRSTHQLPLRHFLDVVTGQNSRRFSAERCMFFALTHRTLPLSCGSLRRPYFSSIVPLVSL